MHEVIDPTRNEEPAEENAAEQEDVFHMSLQSA
jgi:hypothetical protein